MGKRHLPAKDNISTIRELEQRQEWEEHSDCQAVDWDTLFGAFLQEGRSMTIMSQSVQGSGGAVHIGVTSRVDGRD